MIVGPTGVGKSDFAERCAASMDGIIVNGDMGQLYKPLSIGTSKPDLSRVTVPHMLFDIIDSPLNFSAHAYRESIASLLKEEAYRSRPIFIVGGSLFYFLNLFFVVSGPSLDGLRDESGHGEAQAGESLWQRLSRLDPERAMRIAPGDRYRIERSLRALDGGSVPSAWSQATFTPVAHNFHLIHLTRERDELYGRINERVKQMLSSGWLEEVARLDESWKSWLCHKKIIGYSELIADLSVNDSCCYASSAVRQETISAIQKRTRNYAKRQITFWKMLKKRVSVYAPARVGEINLTLLSDDLYLKKFLTLLAPLNNNNDALSS